MNAIGELVQKYRNYLLLIANQERDLTLQNKVAPSDIVQESLLTAYQHFEKFVGDSEEELLAWLRQILLNDVCQARRTFRTQKRDIQRERPIAFASSGVDRAIADQRKTPRTKALADEETALLNQAMSQLSEEHRQVIRLRSWSELSFAKIGEQME